MVSLRRLLFPVYLSTLSQFSHATISDVTPAEWDDLNASVGGRLYPNRPIAFPCYTSFDGASKSPNFTACVEAQSEKTNVEYISSQPGGFIQANWGICQATNRGCPLPSTSKRPRRNNVAEGTCDQGNIPGYFIDVREVSDVQKGLKFANKHGVQIVIKNTGHDVTGRSAAPNSLSLWTHNYQPPVTLTNDFVPEGCDAPTGNVVTFGAGQQWSGIYEFAEAHNVTVVGSSCGSVGAAGGWITGGGHSALSPVYGLGVDNVQQFRVVLPDGTFVTANRCQNEDIFFALRGGGGGTFGVVMEMSTLAHKQVTVQWANFKFPTLSKSQLRHFLEILVENANRWAAEGWGGYSHPTSKRDIEFVNPLLSPPEAAISLKPLTDFAQSLTAKTQIVMKEYPSWYEIYAANLANPLAKNGNSGSAMSSRLIPSSNFEGARNQKDLVDALIASFSHQGADVIPTLLMVAPSHTPDDDSSITPVWREATWHVIMTTSWNHEKMTTARTYNAFTAVHEAIDPLRAVTPFGAAYINEADTFEQDPINSFWGQENYDRLVRIKKDIDPNTVMQVHNGIGWDSKADIFQCYPKSADDVVKSQDEL